MARIIEGISIAEKIKEEVIKGISDLRRSPILDIFMFGDNPASNLYISNFLRVASQVGIKSNVYKYLDNISFDEINYQFIKSNNSDEIDGILLQLPMPKHLDQSYFLSKINPMKDVDGFHRENLGLLLQGNPRFCPCTPSAIISILEYYNIPFIGKSISIINDSIVIGRPLAIMLCNIGATVTICNQRTENIKNICNSADILVVAVGRRPEFVITEEFCKKDAIIIDVGINKINGKIVGDVDLDSVKNQAKIVTKVPGGVGVVTIAKLLSNVLLAAQKRI